MRYAIKSANDVLAEVETFPFDPEDDVYYEAEHLFIEREDGEALIGIVLDPDGGVQVGHWPDGETWTVALVAGP